MKKYLSYFFLIAIVFSCKEESKKSNIEDLDRIAALESEIDQIKFENTQKDKLIDDALSFFDEVQINLQTIDFKRNEINIKTENKEKLSSSEKDEIREAIKHIQSLREINRVKLNTITLKLANSIVKVKELENMVERLANEIKSKDEQINTLEQMLVDIDVEYSKLFDAYQVQTMLIDELKDEINSVYYCYGTEKELKTNQVIQKRNGFIGIGKKVNLVEGFNERYFTQINKLDVKEIMVEGKSLNFITNHPSNSYELISSGNLTKVKIIKSADFWKFSKYLVITVE